MAEVKNKFRKHLDRWETLGYNESVMESAVLAPVLGTAAETVSFCMVVGLNINDELIYKRKVEY